MPLAPPVTIAVRPTSLAISSFLPSVLSDMLTDELFETIELQLDHILGRLIGELERLLVEFLGRESDEYLGPDEDYGFDGRQRLAQMILHARAAENTAGAGLDRHRLALERVILQTRGPVDRVLQASGDRPVVFRRDDDEAVGGAQLVGPGG